MLAKPALTATPIHDLLAQRWSPRAFDAQRTLAREQVLALMEAARWAPSCFGDEPWRFIVCDRAHDPRGWQRAFNCLAEGNQAWVKNTPLLIVVGVDSQFRHNGKENRWAQYDTGAASMSICLQAVALGLAAHQMGGFDASQLQAALAVPANIRLMSVIAVGYQATPEHLGPDLQQTEIAPRKRQALSAVCFESQWDKPWPQD